jgi:hypothetical protein
MTVAPSPETAMRHARSIFAAAALAVALGVAGASGAEPAPSHLDLSRLAAPDAAQREDAALRDSGLAHTALERRFARSDASASVGFLCGRQPSAITSGAAAAYGVDPQGRFLGAQLRLPFH